MKKKNEIGINTIDPTELIYFTTDFGNNFFNTLFLTTYPPNVVASHTGNEELSISFFFFFGCFFHLLTSYCYLYRNKSTTSIISISILFLFTRTRALCLINRKCLQEEGKKERKLVRKMLLDSKTCDVD